MKNERLWQIDVLRGIAIACVVLCHSTEGIYQLNLEGISKISMQSEFFGFAAFTIGRLGVPIFLFITGYFTLDRTYTDIQCKKFWKKNWLNLLLTTEIWIVIYHFFLIFYHHQEFDIFELVEEMLFLKKVNISHMWYMPMILGMYPFIPLVANTLNKMDVKLLKVPVTIISLYVFIVPMVNVILGSYNQEQISIVLSLGFSGGCYGLYIIFGYLIKKGLLKQIKSIVLIFTGAIMLVCAIVFQIFAYAHFFKYNIWYDNAFLLICALCVFELFTRIRRIPFRKIFLSLSKYSFAIYLIHNLIRFLLIPYMSVFDRAPIRVFILWITIITISCIIIAMINRIPKAGKVLLYIRE